LEESGLALLESIPTFLLEKLKIAQMFEKFLVLMEFVKVHYHAHKNPPLDPILIQCYASCYLY
jgi:hypothetical protein